MRANFSIRTKLTLVSLLLLLIPWMSYSYVQEMKSFLLSGQSEALSLTSRAIATVLHDRPELFAQDAPTPEESQTGNEIYAVPLPNYINLDGNLQDWGEQALSASSIALLAAAQSEDPEQAQDFKLHHVLGYHGRYIYALFQVVDEKVMFRKTGFLRVDAADHIRLTLQNPNRPPQRYTLIARESGRMSIYLMDANWQYPATGEPNYDLAAQLSQTDHGYNVELRIPRFMMSSDTRIQLAVADIDNEETLALEELRATTPQNDTDELARVLVRSAEIAKILKGLDRDETRIWVFDHAKKVRTVVGNISNKTYKNQRDKPYNSGNTWNYIIATIRDYYDSFLGTIFTYIIEKQPADFIDYQRSVEERNDQIITKALQGEISTDRRPSVDNLGEILMSGHPVFLGDDILGAVVVEQSTNQIREQQQTVLENLISITLLVLLTVAASILLFASRLTVRIRRLRNATDNAIDRDGRIVSAKLSAEAKSRDEIGDLSRSVSNMLGRLSQYTKYLRGLPDTLAHEVSNPLNVVNSSLHNLSQEHPDVASSKYLERATNGINRIGSILTNLTEAANLEQALQSETREVFDLAELIYSYVDGYSFSNPDEKFEVVVNTKPLKVKAAPDYIAQVLDKLVDNAIDFAAPDTAILFKVQKIQQFAQIDVINRGSRLPEGMSERIFEPLVSLGRKDAQKSRLGMGLYVVKLITSFHGGDVIARNLSGADGVIFSVTLPLHTPDLSDF